jgi:hypothetical protein
MEKQRSYTKKTILKKQNNVGGLSICNFNTYHKATVNKEVCY